MMRHPLFEFPNFRKLFLARIISTSGDKFFTIAIAWWVISQTEGSQKSRLGILMAITLLPVVLFGPFLGSVINRLGIRGSMVIADLGRAIGMGALTFLFYSDCLQTHWLYGLCFFMAAFNPLFEAAASASLEKLGSEEQMQTIVATDASVLEVSNVLGALLGGVFLATLGIGGAFVFNGISFLVSCYFVLKIKLNIGETPIESTYFEDLKQGFNFLWEKKQILNLMIIFALLNFFAAPLLLFIPMIVRFVLNKGATWVALLEFFFALGAVLTSLALSFPRKEKAFSMKWFNVKLFFPIVVSGLLMFLLAETQNPWFAVLWVFLSGLCVALVNTVAQTAFQHLVPFAMKGRFFALLSSTCFAVIPLAFLLNGFLSETFSLSTMMMVNGFCSVILSFLVILI